MLIASGQNDAAVSIYDQYDASFWEEDDTHALRNLVHGARRQSTPPRGVDGRLLLELPPLVPAASIAGEWPSPAAGAALAGARGLTLRLTGEAGWDVASRGARGCSGSRRHWRAPGTTGNRGRRGEHAEPAFFQRVVRVRTPRSEASFRPFREHSGHCRYRTRLRRVARCFPFSPTPLSRRRWDAAGYDGVGTGTGDSIQCSARSHPVFQSRRTRAIERDWGAGL